MFHIKSLRLGQPFLTKSTSKRKIQQIYYKKGCPLLCFFFTKLYQRWKIKSIRQVNQVITTEKEAENTYSERKGVVCVECGFVGKK